MKKWIFLVVLLVFAWLYGWRFYPQNILNYLPGKHAHVVKGPIITHEAKNNKLARWRPQDFLDNFNGNKEYNASHPKKP